MVMAHIQTLQPAADPGLPTAPAAADAPSKPKARGGRRRNLPPRDEHGRLRVVYEVAPTATLEQRERFKALARMLHQRWFIDQPSPLWVDGKPPAAVSSSIA